MLLFANQAGEATRVELKESAFKLWEEDVWLTIEELTFSAS